MDKIDMSLDDIIKQQKKEKAKQARKKAVLTKQRGRVGNKANQSGVSPLNRTVIKPSSIVDGKKAYSARYIKPFRQNVGWNKTGNAGNRNTQGNNKVKGQLKQKANQRQRQFNQRRGLNTQVNITKGRNQTKRISTAQAVRGGGRGRGNRGRGRQAVNSGRGRQAVNSGRGRQAVNSGRGRQAVNSGRGRQAVYSGRGRQAVYSGRGRQAVNSGRGRQAVNRGRGRQANRTHQMVHQPVKTMKANSQPAMLKVSINNTTNSGTSNGPVKLKRNTFMNRKPSTLNERFSNFQRENKRERSNITQRTVLF